MTSAAKLLIVALAGAILLSACAQGGRVAMGNNYAAVSPESVQILFGRRLGPPNKSAS